MEYYQSFLDDTDIPDDKKQEFIETIWNIVVQFVDMGLEIHPLQQAQASKDNETAYALAEFITRTNLETLEHQPTEKE